MKYDVIVMGAGHNGLVAAAYLAKAGKSVLMLEAADEIGGATASVRVFEEYDALLSRYSYLVALLPDQIVQDLTPEVYLCLCTPFSISLCFIKFIKAKSVK